MLIFSLIFDTINCGSRVDGGGGKGGRVLSGGDEVLWCHVLCHVVCLKT